MVRVRKRAKNFQGSRKCGGGRLRPEHGRQGVRGATAGTRGDYIINGLIQLVAGALDAFEIFAKGARDQLFNRVGLR